MKDFFGNQERARAKTAQLIVLFALSIAVIVLSVYAAVTAILFFSTQYSLESTPFLALWDPARFILVVAATLLIVVCGTAYKILELRAGGGSVARRLGGRLIARDTHVPEEKRLFHVVEEIAIASGVAVPDLYVMDHESGINAFAAGFGINDAVISVTRGALMLLDRDELQGVVAHEFSHILNSDTLINIRLMGWLHGIMVLNLIGDGMWRSARFSKGRGTLVLGLAGISLYGLGSVGLFFGGLIKSAISRQREYLADAAAVQFTRNPAGLAGALKKIGGLRFGSRLIHPRVNEASHMYFSAGSSISWMDTHPPLIDRIERLDPQFRGVFPIVQALPGSEPILPELPARASASEAVAPVVTGAAAVAILETVGAPMKAHAEEAKRLIESLPDAIRQSTREASKARALIYWLLLDPDDSVRETQLADLKERESPEVLAEVQGSLELRTAIPPRARLPLLDLAMPALRSLSRDQYILFKQTIKTMVAIDRKITFFEYLLSKLVLRRLNAHFGEPQRKVAHIYGIKGIAHECSILLSFMARRGHRVSEQAGQSFEAGARIIRERNVSLNFLPEEECTIRSLDLALDKMAVTSPRIKRKVLAACLKCMTFDQNIAPEEIEVFRLVAQALDCPVPPWASVDQQ